MRCVRSIGCVALAVAAAACQEKTPPAQPPAPAAPHAEAPKPAAAGDALPAAHADRLRQIRGMALFDGLTFDVASAGPFLVLQQADDEHVAKTQARCRERADAAKAMLGDGKTPPFDADPAVRWADKPHALARRTATLLADLDRRFRELFAERMKLPKLEDVGRVVVVVSLWDQSAFKTVMESEGLWRSELVRVRDRPTTHELVTYLGDDFLMCDDELACADGRRQKLGDQTLLSAACAELMRQYAEALAGRKPYEDDPTGLAAPRWFTSGFADWLGAIELPADRVESPSPADVLHERIRLAYVAESRGDRENAEMAEISNVRQLAERWTLKQLMKPRNVADAATLGEKLAPGRGARSGFDARAWAFCHFLWNYADGKYRAQFTDFVGRVLSGGSSSQQFAAEVMKRPGIADWGDVEREYEWYWNKLLERKVGRRIVSRVWETPTTDAPTGVVEDDEEFLEYWRRR